MEEHIEKLNQLDRIEYRLKKIQTESMFYHLYNLSMIVLIFFVSISTLFLFQGIIEDKIIIAKSLVNSVLMIGLIIFVVLIFLMFIFSFYDNRKLNKDYFEVKVKRSKK